LIFFLVYAFPNQQVFNRGSLLVCLLVIVIFFLKPVLKPVLRLPQTRQECGLQELEVRKDSVRGEEGFG